MMRSARRRILLAALVFAALAAPSAASADPLPDLAGFHISSPLLFVDENAGAAVIEVDRLDTSVEAQVHYNVLPITAERNIDYTPVNGTLDFPVGVASETFSIPIVDHGVPGLPKTLTVSLFAPS